jgi:lipopolysaccharide assembly outer membrane protein LptD (OstA)
VNDLYSQENNEEASSLPEDSSIGNEDSGTISSKEIQRIELEIKTSTLGELALWCRTLGLPENGTRAELSSRIRNHLEISESPAGEDIESKIITIESADIAEYFKIDVVDEDYARLSGKVSLKLIDKDSTHKIKANEILLNRTRNIFTAKGEVEYIKEHGDTVEIFRGNSITVNIDDWSSIFLDGISERRLENEGTSYRFSGSVISRNDEDVTVMRNAEISNAGNEEALWSIKASKLWLLPGSDFAIFNAVLKVGEIPVLYIPFFYFPADEVIFHPVIGFRSREGGFAQTTTYILGRPEVNEAETSSIARILGNSNDMEKERQGLFLRSTGRKIKDPDQTSLKMFIDYYTNLGGFLNFEFTTPGIGILKTLDQSLGIAYSRTITRTGNTFDPYAPYYDGEFHPDNSNLFGNVIPFRYRFKNSSSLSGKYGGLSWNIPYYSDPFIDIDFLTRSENMDWVNMVQQGASVLDSDEISANSIQSYQWHLSGRLTPSLNILSPYVSGISINNISMTLAFKTIEDKGKAALSNDSPERLFFAPDRATLFSLSGSIAGTPLTLGKPGQSSNLKQQEPADIFKGIGSPVSPWPVTENANDAAVNNENLIPPVLSQRFDLPNAGNLVFNIGYQLSPTASSELQFRSGYDHWKTINDVRWDEVQSILDIFGGNGNLAFNMDHSENFFTNSFIFAGSGSYRNYSFINEEAEAYLDNNGDFDPLKAETVKRQQYNQTFYSTTYGYSGAIRPLYRNAIFSQSNITYGFKGQLIKSNFTGTGDMPEWENEWGSWEKEKLESHQISTNFAANVMDYNQNLNLTADLPPFYPKISANATMRAWISETNGRILFHKPETFKNEKNDEWRIDPFHFTERLNFGRIGDFSFYFIMEPEENNEMTTFTTSLSLWDFRASFSAVKIKKYEFISNYPNPGGMWIQNNEDPSLRPRDLTFSYNHNFSSIDIIKNWLNFSVSLNTRLFYDLQRYTNSNFLFNMSLNLSITKFLDLSLIASSENTVIFRYFKGIRGMSELTRMYPEGDQNNLFIDLFDSFNFADINKRMRSGFKMKGFGLQVTHKMGDWNAILGIQMSTYLNSANFPPKYDMNTDISFLVQWSAITEIKSDIRYEKKTDTFTVK